MLAKVSGIYGKTRMSLLSLSFDVSMSWIMDG